MESALRSLNVNTPGRKQVAFVVNGDQASAMGQRAAEFAKRLHASYQIDLLYREGGKFTAARRFGGELRRINPRLVCVFDHGFAGVIAAAAQKRRRGTPWILDTGDDIVALGNALGRRGLSMWMTRWLDRLGYASAARVVVRGRGHRELLAQRGIDSAWIPDGVNLRNFPPPESGFPLPPSPDNPLVIGVLGSSVWSEKKRMCYGQDLIGVVHQLRSRHRPAVEVRGIMIGDGSGIDHLKAMAAKLGLANEIEFLGRREAAELPHLVSRWHIGLSTQTNDRVGAVRTTGKLPIYLACGRFVIASRVGEAARILPQDMLVDYEGESDPEYPRKVAVRIAELLRRGTDFAGNNQWRDLAQAYFDYDKLADDYRVEIEKCLQNPLNA